MATTGEETVAAVTRLKSGLDEAIRHLTTDARPPAAVLEALTTVVREAHDVMAAAPAAEPGLDAAERLNVMRLAIDVRSRLMVVARLAAGSAWFAALARELDGGDRARLQGMYRRDGAAAAPVAGSSIERRA